jgi:hypothetical protein
MTVKELKDILNEYGPEYDNCEVACYETYGTLGYANVATRAYIGKTYVNQGYPIRRMLQIQFEVPDEMRDYIKENCPEL